MGKAAAVSDSRHWVKYLILLYAVLFLSAINGCYSYCTAADKQQSNPQGKIAVVTGLRRSSCIVTRFIVATVVITWQLRRYDLSLGDFLCCFGVLVILLATGAVPILDIALGSLGRHLCIHMLEVGVVVRVKAAVAFFANLTDRLNYAGCFATGVIADFFTAVVAEVIVICVFVVGNGLAANIADMVIFRIFVIGDDLFAEITDMVFVCVLMVGDRLSAEVADMILIRVFVVRDDLFAEITDMVFICVLMVGDDLSAVVADMILIRVLMVGDDLLAIVADMIFVCVLVVGDRLSAVVANMIFVRVFVIRNHFAANIADMVFVRILVQARISALAAHAV